MGYTVKKLSELSKVTVRTLHFYEEEGLLKPAYYGSNGYRYYEEKELLQLQQILFFKELGFTIKQIKKVLGKEDFDKLAALHLHRKALCKEWEKIGVLLKTIDKTISHLNGKKKMKDTEIFAGFNINLIKKAKESESYFEAEKVVVNSVRSPTTNTEDVEKRGQAFYTNITETAHGIFREIANCLEKGDLSHSSIVQGIIKKHHMLTDQIHNANQEVYKALATLYKEHPEFRKELEKFHPKLPDFMSDSMLFFANNKLK